MRTRQPDVAQLAIAIGIGIAGSAASARAQSPTVYRDPNDPARVLHWQPGVDVPPASTTEASPAVRDHAEQRPFAFVLDPTTPSARDITFEYGVGMASGVSAERPLPSTVTASRVEHSLTLGYGLTDRIAPFATVRLLQPTVGHDAPQGTGAAGLRWQLTSPQQAFRLTISTAAFREFAGSMGGYGRLAASYDIDRLRLAANVHAEHVFETGRDAVDVLAMAGASYAVLGPLRTGVEYVGQDLEESFGGDNPEGGARHFLGPDLALDLLHGQLQLVAGAAMGIADRSPPLMGRVAALATF